jgi:hypothetical protein
MGYEVSYRIPSDKAAHTWRPQMLLVEDRPRRSLCGLVDREAIPDPVRALSTVFLPETNRGDSPTSLTVNTSSER